MQYIKGSILYHVGYLVMDRGKNADANILANKMMRLYERGEYHLVQKRRYPGVCIFEYWAIPVQRRPAYDTADF